MPTYELAPSLLSANFAILGDEANAVLNAGADMLHLDVMDNHYVPNLTVGPLVCEALRKFGIKAPIDVHLMVEPVDDLIVQFAKAGATDITIHPEATRHLDRSLSLIRELGCKAGLAFNPATPLNHLDHLQDKLDLILIMSVNPGFGGQGFLPASLDKIKTVRAWIDDNKLPITLSVDGGIKVDNIATVAKAGARRFVAGSAIYTQPNYRTVIDQMRQALAKA
ncbi:MAG TPA: ribulose-phosphate 3-epimerase [Gammaproteobacteria bacterium]|nr:ribulose-phosphate 3-epimerase [Gammaproteobacteria bacterium]